MSSDPVTYTGVVSPGGPSDYRDLGTLIVRKCSVGSLDNNCYLLTCTDTQEQILIDAADDVPRLQQLIDEGSGHLSMIVTTHRHHDHVRALPELAALTQAATLAGRDDAAALPLTPDRCLTDGDEIVVGRQRLTVIELRGHTPGGIALSWTAPDGWSHLFTGDSLFPGGPGKTSSPQEFNQLMDDLESRIFGVYDDSTWVYPGHGSDTTVGTERPHLSAWRDRGW
ncbi:Hydroxyacylglutathione hydrolase GloC [Austwickia sp. TVS 96-490-7B]|uniref:MBL fold metallo-hydrolase n=1 Tax=Austwickia sp. TVS 96-490-7B TaxID=2830843 RepID=UPI001D5194FC|nr:Hydroxyacylglutathione hydrolase GloC [Austwickia sp. TVS 96-490-7B]